MYGDKNFSRNYKPKHPEKYKGNHTSITLRSSWEVRFAIWCDNNPNILWWSSEETIVPYRCQTDQKMHRYFIDFTIHIRDTNGNEKTYLVEIKPDKFTKPPKYSGRKTKRYLSESADFIKNQSKWHAASAYAKERGYEFKVITEKDLGIA